MIDKTDLIANVSRRIFDSTRLAIGEGWESLTERDIEEIKTAAGLLAYVGIDDIAGSVSVNEKKHAMAITANWSAFGAIEAGKVADAFWRAVADVGADLGKGLIDIAARAIGKGMHDGRI